MFGVDGIVVGAEIRIEADVVGSVGLVPLDSVGGDGAAQVNVSGAECTLFSVTFNGQKVNAVEADVARVAVVLVFCDFDSGVEAPGFEGERAVADEVLRFRPVGDAVGHAAVFEHGGRVHGPPSVVSEQP